MDTVTILKKGGSFEVIEGVYHSFIAGNNLFITTKTTEFDDAGQAWLFTINNKYDLTDITSYTVKIKSSSYGKE